ncbi:MAG: hypothetical protein LIO46_05280 [Clostridiales bacterium]|nr:hypothetical protein [Clostridiales bacterium]
MKVLKAILKLVGAIIAVAGVGAAIYLLIQRFTGDKKAATYYDDEDFFECDCDLCEVVDCEGAPAAEEAPAEAVAEPDKAEKPKKATKAKK